jgi:hypothetical protein
MEVPKGKHLGASHGICPNGKPKTAALFFLSQQMCDESKWTLSYIS